jgi:hypothetical protein
VAVNAFKPHLVIVPEDDANKALAIEFFLKLPDMPVRAYQVEPVAGGWLSARERLLQLCRTMTRFPERHVLVLVDFDESADRRDHVVEVVPEALRDRVFVLGVWSEPEALQSAHGHAKLAAIGHALARECDEGGALWQHALLAHNAPEVARLRPFLGRLRS